ncbi:helix-turn-helix transcriptional regulator [Shewanella sp. 1180_01]|uniref:helix-turn-helix transcriptional regulator n=1 Tax=Shewanella sp. 1180_01 TaxID=2604451 RepID=UPI0040643964
MKLIRLKDVIGCTGHSRSTIYKYIDEGIIPKSVSGDRTVAWGRVRYRNGFWKK